MHVNASLVTAIAITVHSELRLLSCSGMSEAVVKPR